MASRRTLAGQFGEKRLAIAKLTGPGLIEPHGDLRTDFGDSRVALVLSSLKELESFADDVAGRVESARRDSVSDECLQLRRHRDRQLSGLLHVKNHCAIARWFRRRRLFDSEITLPGKSLKTKGN